MSNSKRAPFQFRFPNELRRNDAAIKRAFAEQGLSVADISREGTLDFWVWVLTECGRLYLLDLSHGGGGCFQFESGPLPQ